MTERELSRVPVGHCDECSAITWRVEVVRVSGRGGITVERIERIEYGCGHAGKRPGESEPLLS